MMFAQEGVSARAGGSRSGSDAMKSTMLLATVLVAGPAFSQEMAYVDTPVQGRENVSYAFADVLRAVPTYEIVRAVEKKEECVELPAADAALPAAANGDASDGHDGPPALAADPAPEDEDSRQPRRDCRLVDVEREERHISGYDVEYRYKGQLYMSHMEYDPGNKLRIRVTVAPAD